MEFNSGFKGLNSLGTLRRRLHYDYRNSLPGRQNFTSVNINKQGTLAVTSQILQLKFKLLLRSKLEILSSLAL